MADKVWIVTAEYNGGELVSRVFDEEEKARTYLSCILEAPYQVVTPDMYPTCKHETYLPVSALRGVQIEQHNSSAKDSCVIDPGGYLTRISFNRAPDWVNRGMQTPNGYQAVK